MLLKLIIICALTYIEATAAQESTTDSEKFNEAMKTIGESLDENCSKDSSFIADELVKLIDPNKVVEVINEIGNRLSFLENIEPAKESNPTDSIQLLLQNIPSKLRAVKGKTSKDVAKSITDLLNSLCGQTANMLKEYGEEYGLGNTTWNDFGSLIQRIIKVLQQHFEGSKRSVGNRNGSRGRSDTIYDFVRKFIPFRQY